MVARGVIALILAFTVVLSITPFITNAAPRIETVRIVVGYTDASSRANVLNTVAGYIGGPTKEVNSPVNGVVTLGVLKEIPEIRAVVINVPKALAEPLMSKLKRINGVRYVEYDVEARALGFGSYPDVKWNIKMIYADEVWDTFYTYYGSAALGRGVKVAVLDTGIDYTHSDLKGRVTYCINTIGTTLYKGTQLSKCSDQNGHGTHVAGIIAAAINSVGVAGVAPNVTIIAVKVLGASGSGSVSDIAEGIVEAVKAGATILSMSLGSSVDSSVLRDASYWAYQQGAIQVVAAGNSGDGDPSTDNVNYPGRYDWVIAVAAVDSSYNIPSWSSDGPEVDVAAPGVNILSTYPGGKYAYMSGTSMATPHVTGVVALAQAIRIAAGLPPLSFDQMYYLLTATAIDIGPSGFDVYSGYGLVDAYYVVYNALRI